MRRPPPTEIIFVTGATAVGKSTVAVALAEQIGGEIISVDSMQVYRGLDLGTAKPTHEERQRTIHHLIDVAGPEETFDAARFVLLATRARSEIQARGKRVIYCGGTGFYFTALLEGLGTAPPPDIHLRAKLEQMPRAALLRELEEQDPLTFQQIDRRNPRRVIRALEAIRLGGGPFSGQRAPRRQREADQKDQRGAACFVLSRRDEDLRQRIEKRVEDMFARGLVRETSALMSKGLLQNRTAMQAIGYRQVVEHLHGVRSLAETIALVKQRSWQLARRQRTWFRHQLSAEWLELEPGEEGTTTAERIRRQLPNRATQTSAEIAGAPGVCIFHP